MRNFMRKRRFNFITGLSFCLLLFLSVSTARDAYAFQPASHYILMMEAAERLPENSKIRQALQTYPEIAALGANGPDLPLVQPGELFGYSPWSNDYHYFKVGTYAANQMRRALAGGDLKEIAFAAGWITHVCGDLGAHGIFVNPECGVYLDNVEGRELHVELETVAEPYVWVNMGGKSIDSYKDGIKDHFASSDDIPYGLIEATSKEVYGASPSESDISQWITTLRLGLRSGVGYTYTDYEDAMRVLSQNGREDRLKKGFYSALKRITDILTSAEMGDYSGLSDRWVLDVGRSDSPISNLTIEIKTAESSLLNYGTGTDDDIFFGMTFKDGSKKEWQLDAGRYINDFESGNTDKFYLYVDKNSNNVAPDNIDKIWLRKDDFYVSVGGDWYPEYMKVYLNGEMALNQSIDRWFDSENNTYEVDVDFSWLKVQVDGPDPVGETH